MEKHKTLIWIAGILVVAAAGTAIYYQKVWKPAHPVTSGKKVKFLGIF